MKKIVLSAVSKKGRTKNKSFSNIHDLNQFIKNEYSKHFQGKYKIFKLLEITESYKYESV